VPAFLGFFEMSVDQLCFFFFFFPYEDGAT